MKKISQHHRKILRQATACGLNLKNLRKNYTLKFVIKLFKHVKRGTKNNDHFIEIIHPFEDTFDKPLINRKKVIYEYIKRLRKAGFKIRVWYENLIDEESESGKIFRRKTYYFKPLELS